MNGASLSLWNQWQAHTSPTRLVLVLRVQIDQNESFHILRTCLWLNKRLWMPLLTRTRTISSSSSFAFWPSKFWTLTPKQKRTCQGDWPVEALWRRALVKIEGMNNCEKANDHNDFKVLCFWSHKNKPIKAILL